MVSVVAERVAKLAVHHDFFALSHEMLQDFVVSEALFVTRTLAEALVFLGWTVKRLLVLHHFIISVIVEGSVLSALMSVLEQLVNQLL